MTTAECVAELPFDLSQMQEEGCFVDVTTRGFNVLKGALSWRDLGVDPAQTGVDLANPMCWLLPVTRAKRIRRQANRAHEALERYSYRFRLTEAVFGTTAWRWMTYKAFQRFADEEWPQIEAALSEAVDDVIENYDAVSAEMRNGAVILAMTSARRLEAAHVEMPADFKELVVDRIAAMVPTPGQLKAIEIRYDIGALQLGSEMLAEQRRAMEERAATDKAAMEAKAVSADLQAELDTKRRIRQMQLDAARERLEADMAPIDEVVSQLHASLYDGAKMVVESLQKHPTVPPATAKKARAMAEKYRMMAWRSDADLERLLDGLETAATKADRGVHLDPAKLGALAQEIAQHCYDVALETGTTDRMRALEV